MSFRVELYIYDLSLGVVKQMDVGAAFGLSDKLEGIWHTAIVVHDIEWFFGTASIEQIVPGTTALGQPLRVEYLGNTTVTLNDFRQYMRQLSLDQFAGHRYNLFHHNCNTFSNLVAKYLCNASIPAYILELPGVFLNSPLAQLFGPLIQQYLPHGSALSMQDTKQNDTSSSTSSPNANTFNHIPVRDFVTFNTNIEIDKMFTKLDEIINEHNLPSFNLTEKENAAAIRSLIGGGSKLSVSLWESLKSAIVTWPSGDIFPLIDVLRCIYLQKSQDKRIIDDIVVTLIDKAASTSELNLRLVLRVFCNFLAASADAHSNIAVISCFERIIPLISDRFETQKEISNISVHLQLATSAIVKNFVISLSDQQHEHKFELASLIVPCLLDKISQEESSFRLMCALVTLITSNIEIRDFCMALDLKEKLLERINNEKSATYETSDRLLQCMKHCLTLL